MYYWNVANRIHLILGFVGYIKCLKENIKVVTY